MPLPFTLSDFDYALPQELIAQAPARARGASRLLDVDGAMLHDRRFADLAMLLRPGDLAVFNDTRVIHARAIGRKPSGGRVEMLVERIVADDAAWVQLGASHLPKPGGRVDFAGGVHAVVEMREGRFFLLRFHGAGVLLDWLEQHGDVPLPPYIARPADADDVRRYQTVYARAPGAVAAPTAGLHFDEGMFAALAARGVGAAFVTLHVGAGTFQPVTSEDLAQHRMHSERYAIPDATARAIAATGARGGRILAVGTTTLRALESAAEAPGVIRAGEAETDLFITPGHRFRIVDLLLTNFHLPRSTLLVLVAAFAGHDVIRAAYAHAIGERYRFFSYGDAMLLRRAQSKEVAARSAGNG